MAYSKNKLEVHSFIAGLYERYRDKGFISFKNAPEVKGTQYLEPLIDAIQKKEVIRLFYQPFYEDRPYFNEVHPYLLKEHGFRWYLVGFNAFRGQVRTYSLDRIRDLQSTEGISYVPAGFNAQEYFKYSIGIIAPEGTPALIKLAVQKTQAQYLITQPWHDSQNIEEETEDEVIFSFRVFPTYEFKSLVLSLGKDACIREPITLREELKNELSQMLKLY